MNTVFANRFLRMNWDEKSGLMETIWTTTFKMRQQTYRALLLKYLQQLEKYRPTKLLIDTRKADYVIGLKDQDWINTNIFPQTAHIGVQKMAFLIGTHLFLQVSLEQLSEKSQKNELVAKKIQQRFFENYQNAKDWLAF